jgi:hypothetical protein
VLKEEEEEVVVVLPAVVAMRLGLGGCRTGGDAAGRL